MSDLTCKTETRYFFEVEVPLKTKPTDFNPETGLYYRADCHEAALNEAGSLVEDRVRPVIGAARKRKKLTGEFSIAWHISLEDDVLVARFTSTAVKAT